MEERLANEILDAANNTGGAVKKREDTHKWLKLTKHSLTIVGRIVAFSLSMFHKDSLLSPVRV